MPLYQVTLKHSGTSNGIRYEQGMSVQVATPTSNNPVLLQNGQLVIDAFMRMYGIDVKKAGLVSSSYMQVDQI